MLIWNNKKCHQTGDLCWNRGYLSTQQQSLEYQWSAESYNFQVFLDIRYSPTGRSFPVCPGFKNLHFVS
jgi:hypothetical protein